MSTNNFDNLCKKILEDIDSCESVLGATGASYADGDARVPKVLMQISRNGNKSKKRKRKK